MDRSRLGIVIPALNEARTIGSVVTAVAPYGRAIVVDDGSSDATSDAARAAGAEVVRHETNRGYDGALTSGFIRAATLGCRYILTMDADGQHDPRSIEPFVTALDEGADVVIGIRDRHQRIGESIFAVAARLRWGIHDVLCGFKAYRIEVWQELGHFDSYRSIGTELAIYAAATHKRIIQLPVMTRDRTDAPRFGRQLRANLRLLRAAWRGVTRAPKPTSNVSLRHGSAVEP